MARYKKRQVSNSKEEAIQAAIKDYNTHKFPSMRKAAAAHEVPINTLSRRLKGAQPRSQSHPETALLTPEQEESIVCLCLKLDGWGNPLKLPYMKAMVLHVQPQETRREPGKHWVTRFINCHPIIASKIASRIDRQRATAENPIVLAHFFKLLGKILQEYRIEPQNIWNIDEKGFMMGKAHKCRVICRRGRRNPKLVQDGDRKSVTVIEGVSAAGQLLEPMIIHQGKGHTAGWYAYVSEEEEATFAFSSKGWTDNTLGVEYLEKIFDKHTSLIAAGKTRLLILDGHGSHVSLEFLLYGVQRDIVILCLPPHTSHVLQPLDVGLFAHLERHYTEELDEWTRHGLQHINRAEFYKLLVHARKRTYSPKLIQQAFESTGIYPFNARKVLEAPSRRILHGSPPPSSPPLPATPKSGREVNRLGRDLLSLIDSRSPRSQRIKAGISKLVRYGERMEAEHDIEEFRHQQLCIQVLNKPPRATKDRRVLSRARVVSSKEIVQLIKKREAKVQKKVDKEKAKSKGKKVGRGAERDKSSEPDAWEDVESILEDDLDASLSDGNASLEDVIIVGG